MDNTFQRKSNAPRWFLILAGAVLLAALGLAAWNGSAAGPTSAALAALESDSAVRVEASGDLIIFEPLGVEPTTGLIFYPGGKVDFRAYAPALRIIAAEGVAVFAPEMPLHLAFFDVDAADRIISANPGIISWAVGGHSLGGVAAASYAAGNPEKVEGVVFWASYPQNDALKSLELRVLSVFGTLDGLTTLDEIEASRSNLPADATFLAIEGGNHAQFGAYGPQEGDRTAEIPGAEQQAAAATATAEFLLGTTP